MPYRSEQVATQIQKELSEIIRLRMSDPRVGYVTITRVKLSDDLSFARVYVSEIPVEGQAPGRSIKALMHATGFLRTQLGKRLRLRQVPELRFEPDSSIESGIRMTKLLDGLAEERRSGEDECERRDDT